MAMSKPREKKPSDERKGVALRVLVTEEEQVRIQAAAARESRTVSAWMRLIALEKASPLTKG